MSSMQPPIQPPASATAAPEKYLIAFVIQGDDVFKITADNIIHTTGTAGGPAFDAIAKLKAAAALLELTNRHKERPEELRQMARELASEGMKLMASASSDFRSTPLSAASPENAAEEVSELAETTTDAGYDAEAQEFFAGRPVLPERKMVVPQSAAPQVEAHAAATGMAPVPKPEERNSDADVLPNNSKIALISG